LTLYQNGTIILYDGDVATDAFPSVGVDAQAQLATLITELDSMVSELDVNAPWNHPNALVWDSMTLKTLVDTRISLPDSRFLFETAITSILSTETHEPSLLYMLSYIVAAGN
jgi:monoamine oxidase